MRFVSVELREPEQGRSGAGSRGGCSSCSRTGARTRRSSRSRAARWSSWEHIEGVHAAITGDEYAESEVAVKADEGFRRALALRGVHDLDLVMVDTWSVGLFEGQGERVGRALAWLRSDLTGDNGYARPIGGLIALVDLDTMQVVRIDDHGVLPVPEEPGDYRDGGGRPYRDDLRPIEVIAAGGHEHGARRPAAALGPVARAHRLQPARVADAARARLRRGRRRRARARSRTGCPSPSSRSRTPTRTRRSSSRTRSTSASTASARIRTRSSSAATAWARSATSTPSCTTATATRR